MKAREQRRRHGQQDHQRAKAVSHGPILSARQAGKTEREAK
jgi:hypothetical protein